MATTIALSDADDVSDEASFLGLEAALARGRAGELRQGVITPNDQASA